MSRPTNGDTPQATAGERRPPVAPGAAAASRARRIGGRPLSAPRPSPAGAPVAKTEPERGAGRAATSLETAPTSLEKTPIREGRTPAPPEERTDGPDIPAWVYWAPAGVLALGVLVMAVLLVVFSHGVWWGPSPDGNAGANQVNQQRERVLAAAKTCVVAANDYAYTDLNGYERRALACTTGELTGKLRTTIETLVKEKAPQLRAKQTTQVNRGGIETVSPDGRQWTLLLFGQLSVVNSNYPKGRTDPFGAEVTMQKVRGKWVMSDLSTVSSPVQG